MPTVITTPTELQNMSMNTSGDYVLGNDIDLNGFPWYPIGGHGDQAFTGSLDGLGRTIRNLNYGDPSGNYAGLFGVIGKEDGLDGASSSAVGKVVNLGIENFSIAGFSTVGALSGYVYAGDIGGITASGVTINASGYGSELLGGMIGYCFGFDDAQTLICDSSIDGLTINCSGGENSVGGFIGSSYLDGSLITSLQVDNCFVDNINIVGVSGSFTYDVGGFVGELSGNYSDCYADGSIYGIYESLGGFLGVFDQTIAKIENCYANVDVYGDLGSECIGGFIGESYIGSSIDILNCYSSGTVNGTYASYYCGGFYGYIYGYFPVTIQNSYSVGVVSPASLSNSGGFGGYTGYYGATDISIVNCAWWTGAFSNGVTLSSEYGIWLDSVNNYLYVPIIDYNNDAAVAKINVPTLSTTNILDVDNSGNMAGGAIDTVNGFLYVVTGDGVQRIDLSTFTVSATLGGVSTTYCEGAVDTTNGFLYLGQSNSILKISLSSFTVVNTLTLPNASNETDGCCIDISNGHLYFSADDGSTNVWVYQISLSSFTITNSLNLYSYNSPPYPYFLGEMVIDIANQFLYTVGWVNGYVYKIDIPSFTAVNYLVTDATNGATTISIDTTNGFLYVGTGSNNLVQVSTSSFTITNTMSIGAEPVALTSNSSSGHVYFSNSEVFSISSPGFSTQYTTFLEGPPTVYAIGSDYSGNYQQMLAAEGWGTDETDNTKFYYKTHPVYAEGGDYPWRFAN